jgi:acetyl-CoA synthetase
VKKPATLESLLHEGRKFPPSPAFSARAHVQSDAQYCAQYARSLADPEGYWSEAAGALHWFRKWDRVLDWQAPDAQWFVGGKTNLCFNAVDRHVQQRGDHPAIVWEAETSAVVRTLTFSELRTEVARFANVLKSLGIGRGDTVTLYMPMVPELAIAVLACARIGAPHSVVFGGFSAAAIRDRVHDAKSKVVVTADGGSRRGKLLPLKAVVDEALVDSEHVQHVVVLRHAGCAAPATLRDVDWHAAMADASPDCPCEEMDAEDLLFLLYTSGTTGKPKGIMHTTGGYMVYAHHTAKLTFDLQPDDLYWCTADVGWVTGHTYILYGILANGVTTFMYEGAPNYPREDRFWQIIARHRVTKFYTAPTAIRAFMKWGSEHPARHDLSSLKVLGTVGEPINPEAWMWYHEHIGGGRTPIVDTWWQTETGGHMITPLPGATTTVPGSATRPFFGIDAAVVDERGDDVASGLLVVRKPWPAMLRGIYGDRDRFLETYWSQIPGCYFTGDGARRDADGNFWIMGRVDDVINVSGHRLGTAEIESALVSHPAVAEAAVVGFPHAFKGTAIAAFVTLKSGRVASEDNLKAHVTSEIGALARPEWVRMTDALPKTRSGKIMRRLLRDIAAGNEVAGDTTTLEDKSVIDKLRA